MSSRLPKFLSDASLPCIPRRRRADCEIAHPGADRLRPGDDRRLDAVGIIDAARGGGYR
jgi:hypothetical protein